MLKPVVVAAAALAIAGSSIVYAQQRFGGPSGEGDPRFEHHYRPSAEDMAAFTDARVAALKAGLQLTPDQAKNWPPFEQALRDMAKLHIERMQARQAGNQQDQATTTPFDRLARHADAMTKTGDALKQIADTGMPLYQSLDDAQKHRFRILARMLRPHHMHASNEGHGPGWRQRFGDGRDGGQNGNWQRFENRRFGQDDHAPGVQMQNYIESEDQGEQL
ncbi:MAG: Spy/CpxP family protein refolding chaperone [Xanthobacteraceae bacterium]